MHHAPNALGGVPAEYWFAAMEADRRRNLLNLDGLALDIKDLADQFLPALGLSAHMTAKHSYLVWRNHTTLRGPLIDHAIVFVEYNNMKGEEREIAGGGGG
jgi:hypothetical protein